MVGGKNIRTKLGEEPVVKIKHTALSQARLAMHSRTVASEQGSLQRTAKDSGSERKTTPMNHRKFRLVNAGSG